MRLTVIMPLFNRQQFVETALQSLLRQQPDCELDILVVNDGSTDDGPRRVLALARRYPSIRMVTTPNQGVTKARNVGLRNLSPDSDFVTFLDSDDVSPCGRLQADLAVFKEFPEVQFTYGRIAVVDRIDDSNFVPEAGAVRATLRGIQLAAAIFRASYLERVGMFDESFEQAEDTDYLFRALELGGPYRLTDTVCVYYRQHDDNLTRDTAIVRKSFCRALHKSMVRRRRNPALQPLVDVFDIRPLVEAQARVA